MKYNVKGGSIIIEKGDITEYKADALVNAANNKMHMGAGVAGAIKKSGGKKIEKEAVEKGPIEIGDALVSSAGNLSSKYIIHAAVMGMDFTTNDEKIKNATKSTFNKADELRLKSIVFPALGTGVGGFPYEEAVEVLPQVTVNEVYYVLFDEKAYSAFKETADQIINKPH